MVVALRMVLAAVAVANVHAGKSSWWTSAKADLHELAQDEPSWWNSLKSRASSAISLESDAVQALDLLRDGGGLSVETCGRPEDLMQVRDVHFDPNTYTVTATGLLTAQVEGGEVKARIGLGDAPKSATRGQRMKRAMVFIAMGKHTVKEELCSHSARGERLHGANRESCPMAAGEQSLHFSFDHLPSVLTAGKFNLTMNAVNQFGAQIACIHGSLEVPTGPGGEMVRRLQMCSAGYSPCGTHCDWSSDCSKKACTGAPSGRCWYEVAGMAVSSSPQRTLSGVLTSLVFAALFVY